MIASRYGQEELTTAARRAGVRIRDNGPKMGLNGVDNGQVSTNLLLKSTVMSCVTACTIWHRLGCHPAQIKP